MDLPFNQFANVPKEVHAITHGVHHGYFRTTAPGYLPHIDDVQAEPHYYKFGYMVGDTLRRLRR